MITLWHVEQFKRYNGDGDAFFRMASKKESEGMGPEHWAVMDSLIQDMFLIKGGLASESFTNAAKKRLRESCDSEATVEALRRVSIKHS